MQRERDVVDVMSGMALFADLSPAQLQEVAHTFDEETFEEGRRILRRGLTGGSFYVIVDGEAAVQVGDRRVSTLGRGDFFGEISILLDETPSADITATSAMLRCIALPGEQLAPFLLSHPTVAVRMLRAQARRMREVIEWRS
ncbi:MAG TPA: cyclic nucleotide-binding domain-containing protein [Actinomycetota bacterium]